MAGKPRYKKNIVPLSKQNVAVYATPKISAALEVINDMSLFEGVKMTQLLEAIYEQGKKDGARGAIDAIEVKVQEVVKAIPHKNPGQPKRKSSLLTHRSSRPAYSGRLTSVVRPTRSPLELRR